MDASSDTGDKEERSDDSAESNDDEPVTKEEIEAMDWDELAKRAAQELDEKGSDAEYTPKKLRHIENRLALDRCLNNLQKKTEDLPWIETLTVSTGEFDSDPEEEYTNKDGRYRKPKNVDSLRNNDIKREIYFYQSTLSAVKGALRKLKEEPGGEDMIQRPKDFYAEMIKTDEHMKRVKGRILWEQKKMGIVESRFASH